MWNAWNAPPGARTSDYAPWEDEPPPDHDEEDEAYDRYNREQEEDMNDDE